MYIKNVSNEMLKIWKGKELVDIQPDEIVETDFIPNDSRFEIVEKPPKKKREKKEKEILESMGDVDG